MICFDAMLYADGKIMDTNQDRLISSAELSQASLPGFAAVPVDSAAGWNCVEKKDASSAIIAFGNEWVEQWDHGLWTSGDEIFSIAMRTERGQFLYKLIDDGHFNKPGWNHDAYELLNEVFYTASATDYYNTVNTLSYLVDEIAPFWN